MLGVFYVKKFSFFAFVPIVSTPASPLNLSYCSRFACATEFPQFSRDIPTERFGSSFPPRRIMPSKILPSQKLSRRRLNTGSALTSRQETTLASAEVVWVLSPKPADYTVVEYRTKEMLIYICNRLWLSSDLQHVDNLVVSDQLEPVYFSQFR